MADAFEIKFNTQFDKAREAANRRSVVLPSEYYGKLPKEMRSLSNTISYIQSVETIQTILEDLKKAIDKGESFASWRKRFNPEQFGITKAHAETVYRNALQTQYSVGRWKQIQQAKKSRPYLRYVTINDDRTSQCCRALSGIIRPVDSPFWNTHTPPNHHRCRSIVVSLTEKEAQKRSPAMVGLNQPESPDMQPQKGWDYNPALSHQKQMRSLLDEKIDKMPNAIKKTVREQAAKKIDDLLGVLESVEEKTLVEKNMTLDDIYKIAEKEKPAFDSKIQQIANFLQGEAILPQLKSVERAQNKITHFHYGDASKIRDVLRASLVFTTVEQVNTAYKVLSKRFDIVADGSRNGYATPIHSSDGYFDAKVDATVGGIFAEIQIHTQAMVQAKEKAHPFYVAKQAILHSVPRGQSLTSEQKKEIESLNKQMRQIYREANND